MTSADETLYASHIETRSRQIDVLLTELGYDALLIHSGRPVDRFLDDQAPPFRANPHFVAWLPLPRHADCALMLRPGQRPVLWYYQPEDYWHMPPAAPEDWWSGSFDVHLMAMPDSWSDALGPVGRLAVIGDLPELATLGGVVNPAALLAGLHEQRTVKTEWEQQLIARANRRAIAGHRAAEAAFRQGRSEFEIHLDYLAAIGQPEAHLPYASIVALNTHAAVLHYQHLRTDAPAVARSFLIDAGADCFGYAADITRTYAAEPGEFHDLIGLLDAQQQQLVAEARAGTDYVDLHLAAHHAVGEVLHQAGIVHMDPASMVESGVTRAFFPHGLGHFVGLQVHDVAGRMAPDGQPLPPPADHPSLRLTRELAPGNVLTIEPGLYFIEALLTELRQGPHRQQIDWRRVDALIPCGGIRIEDNVLITSDQPVNFTREAFAA